MTLHPSDARTSSAVDWSALLQRLRTFARRLTRQEAECDDLVQQTLVALLERRPQALDLWAYARQTLTRLWIDRERSRRRRAAHWLRIAGAWLPWGMPAEGDDTAARLQAIISRLPPLQRACVLLRLVEELDYDEIAGVLQCTVGAVRANLHLARRSVRVELGEQS